jgi:hypothetical protein
MNIQKGEPVAGVHYAYEKLSTSLKAAAAGTAPVQERLTNLIIAVGLLEEHDFPDGATWAKFKELKKATTGHSATMTGDEAGPWMERAFDIFLDIAEACFENPGQD